MHAGSNCSLAVPSNNSPAAYPEAPSWVLHPSEAPGSLRTLAASVEPIFSHCQYLILLPCVDPWKIRCPRGGPWSSVELRDATFWITSGLHFLPRQWGSNSPLLVITDFTQN